MKKENRVIYGIGACLMGCLALAAVAVDTDNDGMADSYEHFFGLNATNVADALLDMDGDSLTNLQEAVLWTDPFITDTDQDGWADNIDSNPVSRAVFLWGTSQFTSNDVYRYTFPVWCSSGFKMDGNWTTNGWEADSSLSNNIGSLNIEVSRDLLTNNAVLDVELFDATNATLFVALCDSNQETIVSNLYGQSIVTGSQSIVTRRLTIPFSSYSNACIVRLWRGEGELTVYRSLMYIDSDGDGLDADQELQAGTSDFDADSDDDGLNDWDELMLTHTNPLNADTDGDGYSDYDEILAGSDPNRLLSLPVNAVSVFGTIHYSGSETGMIRIVADTFSDHWNSALYQEIAAPGSYNLTQIPVLSNLWIRAWRDADGNGLREPWEARGEHELNPRYFTHSISNVDVTLTDYRQNYSMPFEETFEAVPEMAGTVGGLDGQHGWQVTGTGSALVQTNEVFGSSQAVSIKNASVSHEFIGGKTNVWVSYRLKMARGSVLKTIPDNIAVAFFVNSDGHLCVYNGREYVVLPTIVPDGWNRFDFHCDYTTRRWDLRFNHEPVVSNFEFYGTPSVFSLMRLDAAGSASSYMDDAHVLFENPDSDGDGYTNEEEVLGGSNPQSADSIPISEAPVSGTIIYQGSQTGAIHVIAVTDSNAWSSSANVQLAGPGAYSIIAPVIEVWIKAWVDSDGDGCRNIGEAQATCGPVSLRWPQNGVDLTLSIPDSDNDDLSDALELSGKIYQAVPGAFTWEEAEADAERLGGHLATITSEQEHSNIVRSIGSTVMSRYNFWLGASDEALEGDWRWITGERFEYSAWHIYEPNDMFNGEDYVEYNNGVWNDARGSMVRPYLMEIDTPLDPLNPDCDGDGIPDGEEISKGMNPLSLDSDGDGISDAAEVAAGLNGGLLDSDRDGLDDPDELALGTDPLNPDSDGDGLLDGEERTITLTDPLAAGTPPDRVTVLTVPGINTIERTVPHNTVSYIEDGSDLLITSLCGEPAITYTITNTVAGMYRLALQFEPYREPVYEHYRYPVKVSINGNVIGETPAVANRGDLAEGFLYTPWLEPGVYEIQCQFTLFLLLGMDLRVHGIELDAIHGTDSDNDGIPDWAEARLNAGLDSDGDGLSDKDELFTFGTDLLKANTDGDGLKDGAELAAGTDPLNADSDGDGVNDGQEVNELITNPLVAEFDGTVDTILTVAGSATNAVKGSWVVDGTAIQSASRRGELEYLFTLPTQDVVRLEVDASHLWSSVREQTEDTSELDFYVDGIYLGTRDLVSVDGVSTNVQIFLPQLSEGEHTLTVFWENLTRRLVLNVNELRFQQLGGPDANADGIKDWVQASLANTTSIDSPMQSVVSPICLEGTARYPELATLQSPLITHQSSLINRAVGSRWYANVPLKENGKTPVTVSFQNGALEVPIQTEWTAFNILPGTQTNLTLRLGDSVKLTALPGEWNGGQFTLTLNGQQTRSPNCAPLIYSFDQPGSYVVTGEYRKGNQTVTGQVTVTVVGWAFPAESPACLLGSERLWTVELPSGAALETDSTVELKVLNSSPTTNSQQQTTLSLTANAVNGDHVAVARVCPGGAIMDSTRLNLFWVQTTVDNYMRVVERYEDSELWETTTVAKHLPENVDLLIDVFAGGVTLDDYTLERWLTVNDFEANGEYTFRFFHPNDRPGSTCYRTELYQAGQKIGTP